MSSLIIIEGIKVVNSAESYFGDITIRNKRAVIPFFNLCINKGHTHELLSTNSSKYLNFACLIFENVIELSYEKRNTISNKFELITECYGGISIYDDSDYEFWITYGNGKLVLCEDNFAFSEKPFIFEMSEFKSYDINILNLI